MPPGMESGSVHLDGQHAALQRNLDSPQHWQPRRQSAPSVVQTQTDVLAQRFSEVTQLHGDIRNYAVSNAAPPPPAPPPRQHGSTSSAAAMNQSYSMPTHQQIAAHFRGGPSGPGAHSGYPFPFHGNTFHPSHQRVQSSHSSDSDSSSSWLGDMAVLTRGDFDQTSARSNQPRAGTYQPFGVRYSGHTTQHHATASAQSPMKYGTATTATEYSMDDLDSMLKEVWGTSEATHTPGGDYQ